MSASVPVHLSAFLSLLTSGPMFSIAVSARDVEENLKKTYSESSFQGGSRAHFYFFSRTILSRENPSRK
jgi:hypothetical protein